MSLELCSSYGVTPLVQFLASSLGPPTLAQIEVEAVASNLDRYNFMFRRSSSKTLFGGTKKIRRDGYSNANTKTLWWDIRKKVFDRDNGKCQARTASGTCGKPGNEVHHVIPLSRGGTTTLSNLITLCKACHDIRHPGHDKRR